MSDPGEANDPPLDERITELRTVLSLVQHSASTVVQASLELITLLHERSQRDDDDAALDEALRLADHALAMLPVDDDARWGILVERALTLEHRYDRRGDPDDLDAAIAVWRTLAEPSSPLPPESVASALAQLGTLLRMRLWHLVERDDEAVPAALVETQETLQRARDMLPEDDPALAQTCWLLGMCWSERYELDRDPVQLDRAIEEIAESLRLDPDDSGDRHLALTRALHERAAVTWAAADSEVTAEVRTDLCRAIELIRTTLALVPADDPLTVEALWEATSLGVTALEAMPEGVDLAEVRGWSERLQAHFDKADPERSTDQALVADLQHGRILGAALARGQEVSEAKVNIQGFLRRLEDVLGAEAFAVPDLHNHPRLAMLVRADLLGDKWAWAVRLWRQHPPGDERATAGAMLALLHCAQHKRGMMELDSQSVIDMITEALSIRRDDSAWQSQLALVLAHALTMHAREAGLSVSQEAIDVLRGIHTDDPEVRLQIDAALSAALYVRAVYSREIADIEAALAATEEAIATVPRDHELYASLLLHLGRLRLQLGEAGKDEASVAAAVPVLRECLAELPDDDARRGLVLVSLAAALLLLLGRRPHTPEELDEVGRLLDEAAAAPGRLAELDVHLDLVRATYLALRDGPAMLDNLPPEGRDDLRHGLMVAGGRLARAEATRSYADADAAVQQLDRLGGELGPDFRALLWGDTAMMRAQAYRLRAELAPVGQDRSGDRARARAHGLLALRAKAWTVLIQSNAHNAAAAAHDAAELAVQVAGWCVADRDAADAAMALDAGRGLMLQAASVAPEFGDARATPETVAARTRGERLSALMAGLDEAAAARILDPPPLADVQRALRTQRAHALVYLVGETDYSTPVAVVVPHQGEPSIVDLPTMGLAPPEFLTALADNDHRAPRDAEVAGTATAQRPALRNVLPALTHWAWQAVMGPLLAHCEQRGFARPFRLVLVPMGQLGTVPWHAARSPAGRYAVQDAVISYTASARLLCDVVARPPIPLDRGSLFVGDPTGDLPAAGVEGRAIRDRFYPQAPYLADASTLSPATATELLRWLAATAQDARGVLHLACHGVVEVGTASSSRLILAGGETLSAEQLVERTQWSAGACQLGLACLAACSTGVSARGYDEAFSLATAFQVAGVRSVVSSLWRVPDTATSLLMYMLHNYLVEDRIGPAEALRLAQLWMLDPQRRVPPGMPEALRSRLVQLHPDEVSAWAGFVHLGQW